MAAEKKLTARQCATAAPREKVYRLADGGGLFLLVRPDKAKYFQYRYQFGGKEKLYQVGPYPEVSLEQARVERDRAREILRGGRDPVLERRLERARGVESAASTFDAVFWEWMRKPRNPPWAANYIERNEGLYRRLLKPYIGVLPIAETTAAPLREMAKECERRNILESGRRALAIAAQVFDYAIAHELAQNNPARAILKSSDKPAVKHFEALKREQVGELLRKMDEDSTLDPVTKAGLHLDLVTGLRDNELRGARWKEIDFDEAVWTVPGARMKGRKDQRQPLPTQAIETLTHLAKLTDRGPNSYVFASERAKAGHMAENTLRLALHRLGFAVTVHGIRSLLTDTLNEMGFPHDWVERQLAHVEKDKVRRAYLRTDFLVQRAGMMQWWADYCDQRKAGRTHEEACGAIAGTAQNVIPILAARAA